MKRYTHSCSTHVCSPRPNDIQLKSRLSSPFLPQLVSRCTNKIRYTFISNERKVSSCMSGSDNTFRFMQIASDMALLVVVYTQAYKCTALY